MVEANEEGKQVEQEYGYHSYIQPGEYIAKLEGRTWYGKHKRRRTISTICFQNPLGSIHLHNQKT